ncbi:MAG: sulfotransferase domain-containing protein [Desulfobacterales bacterium]|nr:sulfotransferase domain-containing protein [Desulfobacterales bacterium]
MKNFLKKNIAHLTKNLPPDAYIVSYPKSGRTWLRMLIGKSLAEKHNIAEDRIVRARYMTSAAGLLRTRFIHDGSATNEKRSCRELNHDKSAYKNTRLVLLSRDIKDTLVSSYFQATKRENIFEGSLSDFIRSEYFGAVKILEFYRQWYEQRHVPRDFLFIRYESLHKRPEQGLENVLTFLGASEVEPEVLNTAVEYCRFENLRKLEENQTINSGILSPKDPNDPESYKTRKGEVGGYRSYLSDEDIEYIEAQTEKYGCEFTRYNWDEI